MLKSSNAESWLKLLNDGKTKDDKQLEIVYCTGPDDEENSANPNKYIVIEIEVCRMGYLKQFSNKQDYKDYTDWKEMLRKYHNKEVEDFKNGKMSEERLGEAQDMWLEIAKDFVETWGEDYTPEDIRERINDKLVSRSQRKGPLQWTPHERSKTSFSSLGKVDHYKFEMENWDD
jgi:hypothetical protein